MKLGCPGSQYIYHDFNCTEKIILLSCGGIRQFLFTFETGCPDSDTIFIPMEVCSRLLGENILLLNYNEYSQG